MKVNAFLKETHTIASKTFNYSVYLYTQLPRYLYFIGVNRPAIVREITHFAIFPAFLQERPEFLALLKKNQNSLIIAIIFHNTKGIMRRRRAKTHTAGFNNYRDS